MRISCRKDDPGYDPEACQKEYEIRCDGKVIECVVTVDDGEGFVTFLVTDENARTGHVEKTIHGKVTIEVI